MIKLQGQAQAVKDFNNHFGHARIMLDKSTGEIWCATYPSCNEWSVYNSPEIVCIMSKGTVSIHTNGNKTTLAEVKDAAEKALMVEV
jgi:hypothetical protein